MRFCKRNTIVLMLISTFQIDYKYTVCIRFFCSKMAICYSKAVGQELICTFAG